MSDHYLKKIIKKLPPIKRIIEERTNYYKAIQDLKLQIIEKEYEIKARNDEDLRLNLELKNLENDHDIVIEANNELLREVEEFKKVKFELLQEIERLEVINSQISEKAQVLESEVNLLKGLKNPINSKEFWDNHYKKELTSGTGSYAHLAEFKSNIINNFIVEKNIENVIEFGCGDGNQLSLMNYKNYVGVDVSPTIINKNKDMFHNESNKKFYTINEKNIYMSQKYDLAISLDVIFHLTEDNVYKEYMNDLFDASQHYVIVYSSNHEEFTKWPEFRNRKFIKYVQDNFPEWKLRTFIPNKYPFQLGKEDQTSPSDFYIFEIK